MPEFDEEKSVTEAEYREMLSESERRRWSIFIDIDGKAYEGVIRSVMDVPNDEGRRLRKLRFLKRDGKGGLETAFAVIEIGE